MLIIEPLFCFSMIADTALVKLNTDFRLTLITASHCSSVILINKVSLVIPALFTKISIRPNSFAISSTVAALEAYILAFTPQASISFSVACAFSSYLKSVKAIFAPCLANARATAFPIPLEAPVISAVFPSNNFIITVLLQL